MIFYSRAFVPVHAAERSAAWAETKLIIDTVIFDPLDPAMDVFKLDRSDVQLAGKAAEIIRIKPPSRFPVKAGGGIHRKHPAPFFFCHFSDPFRPLGLSFFSALGPLFVHYYIER